MTMGTTGMNVSLNSSLEPMTSRQQTGNDIDNYYRIAPHTNQTFLGPLGLDDLSQNTQLLQNLLNQQQEQLFRERMFQQAMQFNWQGPQQQQQDLSQEQEVLASSLGLLDQQNLQGMTRRGGSTNAPMGGSPSTVFQQQQQGGHHQEEETNASVEDRGHHHLFASLSPNPGTFLSVAVTPATTNLPPSPPRSGSTVRAGGDIAGREPMMPLDDANQPATMMMRQHQQGSIRAILTGRGTEDPHGAAAAGGGATPLGSNITPDHQLEEVQAGFPLGFSSTLSLGGREDGPLLAGSSPREQQPPASSPQSNSNASSWRTSLQPDGEQILGLLRTAGGSLMFPPGAAVVEQQHVAPRPGRHQQQQWARSFLSTSSSTGGGTSSLLNNDPMVMLAEQNLLPIAGHAAGRSQQSLLQQELQRLQQQLLHQQQEDVSPPHQEGGSSSSSYAHEEAADLVGSRDLVDGGIMMDLFQQIDQQQSTASGADPAANKCESLLGAWSAASAELLGDLELSIREKANRSRKKPKNKPKRPLSAYNIFFKEERERILDEIPDGMATFSSTSSLLASHEDRKPPRRGKNKPHGKIGFQSLAKEVGRRWKNLVPERMEIYKEKANADSARYKQEMEAYVRNRAIEKRANETKGEDSSEEEHVSASS